MPYEPAETRHSIKQTRFDGKRVLVADDNATNRHILDAYFKDSGMDVLQAASGAEALCALRSLPCDLILLDWQMPEMSSLELASKIARELGSSSPPVVALSSAAISIADFASREIPVFAVLNKPVRRARLSEVVGRALSGELRPQAPSKTKKIDREFAQKFPLRILLAEDNLVNQKVAFRLLGMLGYQPDAVVNGIEVLEAFEREQYDLVLLDVHMPEMDGLEAARRIVSRWPEERPYLAALTAAAMNEDRQACSAAGMDDFLTKPMDMAQLQLI